MEAVAKYEFTGAGESELSFRKDDILKVLGTDEDWYKAELCGREGLIPKNYIEMNVPSWFYGGISRSEAETILLEQDVGSFLIRASQSCKNEFSISVRHQEDVQHFKVLRDGKGRYFLWSEKFESLNKLVEHYKTTSISKTTQIHLRDGKKETKGGLSFPDPRMMSSRMSDPRLADSRMSDPRLADSRMSDPRLADPRMSDPRVADSRKSDHRVADPRMSDPRLADPRMSDPRVADPRMSDHRVGDPRMSDHRVGDPRMSDHRVADPRMSDHRVADSQMANPRLADSRMLGSRMLGSRIPDPQMMIPRLPEPRPDSRMPNSRMADSRMSNSWIPDSRMPEPRLVPSSGPGVHFNEHSIRRACNPHPSFNEATPRFRQSTSPQPPFHEGPPVARKASECPPMQKARRVRALFDFTAEADDELEFKCGDVIEVLDTTDSSWWKGSLWGRVGLFPSNYVLSINR